ncbi:MAG: 5-histidylcysteine sulfoxide synthase [Candidatus Obscuribacterales bacterium]|jgi:5-histidylcysteine sulfoxide synthase/putative 4-mercaptohistidine N1-methyltranferase|nr:5-histidylcysteine sulfoxide synthase [Candidatus Obscuribacterales bacterium]
MSVLNKLNLSLPIPNLATCTRVEVRDYFNNSWTLTELLFSGLASEEAFYKPPYHELRHPLIFYYAHPAVLYINKLRIASLLEVPLNPYFESLFETGVDEMSWDDMSKNTMEWPTVAEVRAYRKQAYETILSVIDTHPDLVSDHKPIGQEHPLWALFMGFEHERIHLETSSVLIRELPIHLVSPPAQWPKLVLDGGAYPKNDFVSVPATNVHYGKPKDWPTYGWDNEYGQRSVLLSDFEAAKFLTSNGEFLEFVVAGGYSQPDYWSETGWRWRSFRNTKHPAFWVDDGPDGLHKFKLRTCFEIVPMQLDWPVLVNYHEAKAFAKWKTSKDQKHYRLLTEAEHQALRQASDFANDQNLMVPTCCNINLQQGSESPVNQCSLPGSSVCDLFGNAWQWCEDHFNPLEGAKVHPYYNDFSTPCYDGQHQIILGGSFISSGDEATPWARFHFRPHFFQHAGFRLVRTAENNHGGVVRIGDSPATLKQYDTNDALNEYMTLHFGSQELQMPFADGPANACFFPQRCADLVNAWSDRLSLPKRKAMDVGCAVGGASFRLAEYFDSVVGVDLSEQFIRAANELKQNGQASFRYRIEADIFGTQQARVNLPATKKVEFRQADACSIPPEYVDFDAVLLANLLCRLPSPQACLNRMSGARGLVRPGGLLVIVSPYTWMEKFAPRDVWLGGFVDHDGKDHFSEDGLKQLLADQFSLLEIKDMPLVIAEHRRKYQYIVSQAMVWRRKS